MHQEIGSQIHFAAQSDSLHWLRLCRFYYEDDIHSLSNSKQSALHIACRCGNSECVKLLLQWGLDINARDVDGNTPINLAIISLMKKEEEERDEYDWKRYVDVIEELLKRGSRVDEVGWIVDVMDNTLNGIRMNSLKAVQGVIFSRIMNL